MSKLGEALQNARMEKGISLDELQRETKIQKRYLRAIEEGDYSQLPGRFYARAFMKSYAEAVGLDPDELFEEHSGETPDPHQDMAERLPSRVERMRMTSRVASAARKTSSFSIWPKLIAAVMIIGLFVVLWLAFQKLGANHPEAGSAISSGQGGSQVKFSENPAFKHHKKQSVKNKTSSSKSSTRSSGTKSNKKQNTVKQSSHPKLKQTGIQNGVYQYTLTDAKQLKFKLSVTGGDSWVEVRKSNATGNKYVYGMIHPGQTIQKDLSSLKQIYVNIGSTAHVKLSIDGKTLTYPSNLPHQEFLITFQSTQKAS